MSSNERFELEDVLDAIMLEEPEPSYQALLRWCERYPQYRQELADFFAAWGIQASRPVEETDLDEETEKRLIEKGVRYALEIMRRQGRLAPSGPIESLQPIDHLVLTAIYLLRDQAWSASIVEKVSEMSGTTVQFAPVFSSLQRLHDQGLVSVRIVQSETQPEGRSRRYFRITRTGEHALAAVKLSSTVVAGFLADFA